MARYRVHFYDENSSECRSIVVEAMDDYDAEIAAEEQTADWPASFRMGDVEELD